MALMSFGLDVGVYGPLADAETILSLTRHAEATGWDSIWLADHIAFPVSFKSAYPYSAKGDFPTRLSDPLMEPMATMGVLVGATQRVRIGTAALIMPYRNPVLLARMLVTLDRFSAGRIIVGAGVGWLEEEFAVLGAHAFTKRGRVTDEYLEIFKAICAGGEVSYRGETYAFDPIFASPGSLQRPHPPILIGGLSTAALRRVVRHGNGWLAVAAPPDKLRERLVVLERLAADAGRRIEDLTLVYKIFLSIGEPRRDAFERREPGTGSVAEITDDLKQLRDLGFANIIVRYRGTSASEQMRHINRFVGEIAPRV
ncbi:MAG: TIGR03619 family F420-dependent LLM class oxidoreductase [Hyphomicrobiaceae bacterium]|nr:TIGR03619 family F420-dependent LLM class oxidoreductase [Hyphomicrobiaceae bacterium]